MKKKVFTFPQYKYYCNWLEDFEYTKDYEKADMILLPGGADVDPSLYGESEHHTTSTDLRRDTVEIDLFKRAVRDKKAILGICRGSQLSCVMNGGKLIQHVTNHAISGTHKITFNDGEIFDITSTHHQMMYPYNLPEKEYEIIAVSTEKLSNCYWKNNFSQYQMDNFAEPEIVFFKNTKCLAIQGHPEMMDSKNDIHNKLNQLVKWKLL